MGPPAPPVASGTHRKKSVGHALAYVIVVGAGLLSGLALGTVIGIVTGLIPIVC